MKKLGSAVLVAVGALCAGVAQAAVVVDTDYSSAYSVVQVQVPIGPNHTYNGTEQEVYSSVPSPFSLAPDVEFDFTHANGISGAGEAAGTYSGINTLASLGSFTLNAAGAVYADSNCSGGCSQVSANTYGTHQSRFTTTETYNYRLDVTSGGTNGYVYYYLHNALDNSYPIPVQNFSSASYSDVLTGSLLPGTYNLYTYFFASTTASGGNALSRTYGGTLEFELAPVPVPAALWLLVSGLGGLAMFSRRRALAV